MNICIVLYYKIHVCVSEFGRYDQLKIILTYASLLLMLHFKVFKYSIYLFIALMQQKVFKTVSPHLKHKFKKDHSGP